MSNGYEELAAAIVMQAYRDWCDDCKKLASGKGDVDAIKADMLDILKFVKSDWYTALTSIPPEKMIQKLTEEKEKYEYDTERIFKSGVPDRTKNKGKRNKVGRI